MRIYSRSWQVPRQIQPQLHSRAHRLLEQLLHVLNQQSQVDGRRAERLPPCKCQHALGQRHASSRGFVGVVKQSQHVLLDRAAADAGQQSRLLSTTINRLLKSCATPPVS